MPTIHRIAISTGGGDAPGLNGVIRAVVRSAILKHGWEVFGMQDGFDGLIRPEKKLVPLDLDKVTGLLSRGGTILGTTNRGNPFSYSTVENGRETVRDVSGLVIENARKLGIEGIVVIGGDGSQKIALELFRKGLPVVGVPKTIDNDLYATEVTFGFDTAVRTATDAIDKLHDTAESHHRIMVVELMGRDAGWIALEAGIAGAAQVILIPEIPFNIDHICRFIEKRERSGKHFSIVVVAEGVKVPEDMQLRYEQEKRKMPRGGAAGNLIGDALAMCLHRDTRVTVLGHVQRGGSPSPLDRILSTRFGAAAVELIAAGKFGRMVCLRAGAIEDVEIEQAVGQLKLVNPKSELVQVAKAIGISFGDE